ncbi:3-oxo-tetronate 4-phosphate decarboxylase [Novipirellula rosea]|uniref:3-oxo-tetronate 4-phosphate decarboxylase n=1 Tax=Novipirellula rosea TaxID=1031540 RepID=A0ABP8N6J2_9BACT
MSERELRERIAMHGQSLFDRGFTCGSSGNISVRLPDGILVTPTNVCLGRLDPDRISKVKWDGSLVAGDKPSKEAVLHLSMYRSREQDDAIVHLHSTYSVAVSCLPDIDSANVLPALTAYYVMRVGTLPMLPYFPPGAEELAAEVERAAVGARAILLANHGPIVAASDLDKAVYATEELEETAKLYLLLRDRHPRCLTDEQCRDLHERFPS